MKPQKAARRRGLPAASRKASLRVLQAVEHVVLRLIKVDIQGRRRTGTWDVVPGVAGGDANRVGLRQPAQVARRPGERQGAAADAVGDVRRIAGDGAIQL